MQSGPAHADVRPGSTRRRGVVATQQYARRRSYGARRQIANATKLRCSPADRRCAADRMCRATVPRTFPKGSNVRTFPNGGWGTCWTTIGQPGRPRASSSDRPREHAHHASSSPARLIAPPLLTYRRAHANERVPYIDRHPCRDCAFRRQRRQRPKPGSRTEHAEPGLGAPHEEPRTHHRDT